MLLVKIVCPKVYYDHIWKNWENLTGSGPSKSIKKGGPCLKKFKIIIVHEININVTSLEQKGSRALNYTSLDHLTPNQGWSGI